MNTYLTRKINIGISACQLGGAVRYNAKGYNVLDVLDREKYDFNWHPVCPEVMAGLGVPRSPIRLVSGNGDDFWNNKADIKNKFGQKKNMQIKHGCQTSFNLIKDVGCDAFVYMDGSPTCGVTKVNNKPSGKNKAPGVFGSLLINSDLFLIPASDLYSPLKWWDHKRRLLAFVWLKDTNINDKKDIYRVWHQLKFLVQEINRSLSDLIGKEIANKTNFTNQDIANFKTTILSQLKKPQNINKIKQALWKNYKYGEKKLNISANVLEPDYNRGSNALVKELSYVNRLFLKEEKVFGPYPINYKPEY